MVEKHPAQALSEAMIKAMDTIVNEEQREITLRVTPGKTHIDLKVAPLLKYLKEMGIRAQMCPTDVEEVEEHIRFLGADRPDPEWNPKVTVRIYRPEKNPR